MRRFGQSRTARPGGASTRAHPSAAFALAALLAAWPALGDEILVAGAVSLREPLTAIASAYEQAQPGTRIVLVFAASSVLAQQIRAGAPVDVLVSADVRIVDALVAEGFVQLDDVAPLATNRLVVLVAEEAPALSAGPEGLLDVGRIAVPDGAVPVGRYAREWLRQRGLLEQLEGQLVPTEHARATLAAVDLGHVDAAIVYATDARLARSARLALEIPEAQQPRIVYVAARVRGADPGGAAFFAFLRGQQAAAALGAAGFGAP